MNRNSVLLAVVLAAGGCTAVEDLDDLGDVDDPAFSIDEATDELVDGTQLRVSGDYGVLLFDKTGSMNTVRSSTGNTRCADAKAMAREAIFEFFYLVNGEGLAIWTFKGSGVQSSSTTYYTNVNDALAAIDGISCSGSTPLADAMCQALDGDGGTFTLSPSPTRLLVLTDGYENSSNGPCSGPSGGVFTPGTWENNVFNKMLQTGVFVRTRFWVSQTVLEYMQSIDSLAAEDDPDDPDDPTNPIEQERQIVADAEGLPQSAFGLTADTPTFKSCDVYCEEFALFNALADFSGGDAGAVADNNADYPVNGAIDPPSGPVPLQSGGDPIWW